MAGGVRRCTVLHVRKGVAADPEAAGPTVRKERVDRKGPWLRNFTAYHQ